MDKYNRNGPFTGCVCCWHLRLSPNNTGFLTRCSKFRIFTNTICKFDRYYLQFWQIQSAIWTNTTGMDHLRDVSAVDTWAWSANKNGFLTQCSKLRILTNTICNFDKYYLQFWQIQSAIWTNTTGMDHLGDVSAVDTWACLQIILDSWRTAQNWEFLQMLFAILANIICNLDKYTWAWSANKTEFLTNVTALFMPIW